MKLMNKEELDELRDILEPNFGYAGSDETLEEIAYELEGLFS